MSLSVQQALSEGRRRLEKAGIEEASFESELLLRYALDAGIVDIYLRFDEKMTSAQEHVYFELISRRIAGEPSAYIKGQKEFFGLTFYVNPSVLIPRPETELLVEKTLDAARGKSNPVIADVGTGSGIAAVVLAKRLPNVRIFAIDISPDALEIARRNARRHGVENKINFLQGDLLSTLPEKSDIIVANLPYVKSEELPPTGEPPLALNGGTEGLDVISKLMKQAPAKLKPGGVLLMEIGQGQAGKVTRLAKASLPGASVFLFKDLAGVPRVVMAQT